MKKIGAKGYIASRKIGWQGVPQRVQNLVIRNYLANKDLVFHFSLAEYFMDECFMILEGVLEEAKELNALIFYSMHMLPKDKSHRHRIYKTALENGCELHFALEELAIKTIGDIAFIEDILMCKLLSHKFAISNEYVCFEN